jgi:ATP diphosphatase
MAYDEDLIKNPKGGMPRLIEIMRTLRDPDSGCPWDIEQTFETIAPYTIEEAYEVADAIERENWSELRGELGDLLLQSVYHTQMASEAGLFDFDDVANDISDKMVARHPHVFGDESRDKSADQPNPRLGKNQSSRTRRQKCVVVYWMMSPLACPP